MRDFAMANNVSDGKQTLEVTNARHDTLAADDEAALAAIGKVQAFHRKFNFWTALGLTVCISGTWEGISASILQALTLGGPVGLLYGYILTAVAMTCTAAALAELASIWPSAGAQYHWTAELAPPKYKSILSWAAGWITFCYGWLATVSCAMGVAVQIQAYVSVARPDYVIERWHAYLIYVVTIVIYLLINTFGIKLLHGLNMLGIATHIIGYVLTMVILLVYTEPKHDTTYVFTTFINSSGWSSDGVAFCAGLLTTLFGFGGIETAAHFAEEIKHVRRSLPRAMFWTILVNAVLTLPWLIVFLYCCGDITEVIDTVIGPTSPTTQIYLNSTKIPGLAIFLNALASYLAFIGGVDALGSCSRTMWALSRDNAFPEIIRSVHPTLDVPIPALCFCAFFQVLIGMIYIWNSTAFYGIIGGVLALYVLSYGLPLGLHIFYARWHGGMVYGPWNLGRMSLPINVAAFCWAIFIFVFLCFPLYQPVTPANMNYAIVIVVGFLFIGLVWYLVWVHSRFAGPKFEIDVDEPVVLHAPLTPVVTVESEVTTKHTKINS